MGMTPSADVQARECRYVLYDGENHYCHLQRCHEGEHEWYYTRQQVLSLVAAARLEEAREMRAKYHHLEEWERQLQFVLYMDKRIAELEHSQLAGDR